MTVLATSVRMGALARMGWAPTPASAQRPGQVSCVSRVHSTCSPDGLPLASPPHRAPSSSLCPLPTPPPAGWDCSEDVDECEAQGPPHCRNGGTCQNSAGSFHCVCVSGWGGTGCEENLDDCVAATCAPGSTCIDRVGSFSCLCPPGRTGVTVGAGRWRWRRPSERHQEGSWGLQVAPGSLTPTLPSRTPVPHGGHVPEPAMSRGGPVQHQSPDGLHTLPVSAWVLRAHLPPGPGRVSDG